METHIKRATTIVVVVYIVFLLFFPINISLASVSFAEHIITADLSSAYDVSVVDIDKDGHLDIVATGLGHHGADVGEVRWYKNNGHNEFLVYYVITVDGGLKLTTGDFDGDTYLDVAIADYGQDAVYLYLSNGDPTSIPWTRITVGLDMDVVLGVKAADIDLDGDLDIVAVAPGATNRVRWYENTAGGTIFIAHIIEAAGISPHSLEVGDLNKDGFIDAASGWGSSGNSVYWYKNNGTGFWSRYKVSTISQPLGLFFADINGDSDIDIVVAGCDNPPYGTVAWFENDGTPETGTWTPHILATNFSVAIDVFAADMDNDGDVDILAVANTATLANCIAWWENIDSIGISWAKHNITTASITAASDIYVSDIDQDTDNDIFVCSYYSDTVLWFESDITIPPAPLSDISFISIDGGVNGTEVFVPNPIFKWTLVNDTISYQLQISRNIGFTDIVVDIVNINEVSYPFEYSNTTSVVTFVLPAAYSLPDITTYYTRVKALVNIV